MVVDDYSTFASERALVEIARDIPEFGGLTVDQSGRLVAYLTDTTKANALRSRIEPIRQSAVANRAVNPQEAVVVRQGQFQFLDLRAWRDQLTSPVLSTPGVTLLDLAEQRNRIEIGIHDEAARALIEQVVKTAGVPADAVAVEWAGPVMLDSRANPQKTLQDEIYPDSIVGGIQNNFITSGGLFPETPCTIGFVATWNGQRVWLTNSHCTEVERAVTPSTVYWQPRWDFGNYTDLGRELADPLGSACWGAWWCRYSDAAILSFQPGVASRLGYIARPEGPAGQGWWGSIVIDDQADSFRIVSDDEEVGVFWFVEKVGRTTGWTSGQVIRTCVHLPRGNFFLLCQHEADYVRSEGDSGAPVFSRLTSQSGDVRLFGIHNGYNLHEGTAYFSPVSGIRADLGPMTMMPPGPPPPPPPPPPLQVGIAGPANNLVKPHVECLYTASASGGTPPYSFTWHVNKVVVGSGQFHYHTAGTVNFVLEVRVSDAASGNGSNTLSMVVDHLAPDCLDM